MEGIPRSQIDFQNKPMDAELGAPCVASLGETGFKNDERSTTGNETVRAGRSTGGKGALLHRLDVVRALSSEPALFRRRDVLQEGRQGGQSIRIAF